MANIYKESLKTALSNLKSCNGSDIRRDLNNILNEQSPKEVATHICSLIEGDLKRPYINVTNSILVNQALLNNYLRLILVLLIVLCTVFLKNNVQLRKPAEPRHAPGQRKTTKKSTTPADELNEFDKMLKSLKTNVFTSKEDLKKFVKKMEICKKKLQLDSERNMMEEDIKNAKVLYYFMDEDGSNKKIVELGVGLARYGYYLNSLGSLWKETDEEKIKKIKNKIIKHIDAVSHFDAAMPQKINARLDELFNDTDISKAHITDKIISDENKLLKKAEKLLTSYRNLLTDYKSANSGRKEEIKSQLYNIETKLAQAFSVFFYE